MIRAALWDFGGVVTSSPFEAFNAYEAANGLPKDLIRTINATNHLDNAWAKLERNDVGPEGFAPLFEAEAAALGHTVSGKAVLACLMGRVRPEMALAVQRCAENLVCACLTNNFAGGGLMADRERESEIKAVQAHFHHIIESSKVGLRKPDPRIYELACTTMGVEPDEVVYLDDLGVNLKPAAAMGMTTIKVVDPAEALARLQAVVSFPID
ncbi:MAG: HAD-IA family hydrolase [Acidimicrobiales bacterium]|nr:HAD-IA family hydrolase [Acidimicrobiales bacterium]